MKIGRIIEPVQAAATDAGRQVITTTEAAAIFKNAQTELQALAATTEPGLRLGALALADAVGKVRVTVLQGGDVGAAGQEYLSTLRSVANYCTS